MKCRLFCLFGCLRSEASQPARWLRCFRVTGTHNWIQGRVVWWYHICFACGGPWAQSPACPLDRQYLSKSSVRSSARAWRRLDHVNVVGQLGGCDAAERPMLRIGCKGAWCRGITSASHAEGQRVQFDRQRFVKSYVGSSAKAWLRLDIINVVGQLGGCDASLGPVLKKGIQGRVV